ncbi:hypothetical protein D1007_51995 [Hordeum vulgare]|nr:hypothetical protein D1007_51995 [Hordeum vulgare]
MAGGSSLKKSSAQKASFQGAWLGSDVDEGHIEALRHHRLLPPASQVLVRLPSSETAPAPAAGEVVVFVEHFYRGFGLRASSFFAEWLQSFGVQPHHLAPNAILQLAAFVALCEGFVGIEPRVDLWRSLFFFKQQSITMEKSEVERLKGPRPMTPCGATLVHHRLKSRFPQMPLQDSIKHWQKGFFYLFETLQGSLRQPAPDVEVSDASEIEDEGAMEPRSESSAGSEDPLESEGTEPSGEYTRPAVADWMDDDEVASFCSGAAFEEDSDEVKEVTSPPLTRGRCQGGGATAADEAAGKKGKGCHGFSAGL